MSEEADKSWLGCRLCGVAVVLPASETQRTTTADIDDDLVADFLAAHSGHQVTHLHRADDSHIVASGPLWDPMTTVSLQVTDNRNCFVLTSERRSIEEPRRYRFQPGSLAPLPPLVNIDSRDLRRGLDLEFYPHALRRSLVDRFVSVVLELVRRLDPDELDIAFDDANDPSVSIARLPAHAYASLRARSAEIFPPEDLGRVHKFLDENRFEDGLLALRIRRDAQVEGTPLR